MSFVRPSSSSSSNPNFSSRRENVPHSTRTVLGSSSFELQIGKLIHGLVVAAFVLLFSCPQLSAQCQDCQQGRCQYCVEGQCTPKQSTWGYYQTNWRRWPEAAPSPAPCPISETGDKDTRKDFSAPELELPVPEEEAETNPEFPHLKDKADLFIPSEMPANEFIPGNEFDGSSTRGESDGSSTRESTLPFEENTNPFGDSFPSDAIDLPSPDLEGSSSRNQLQPPRSNINVRPSIQASHDVPTSFHRTPAMPRYSRPANPLRPNASAATRVDVPSMPKPQSTLQPLPVSRMARPVSYDRPVRVANPLR